MIFLENNFRIRPIELHDLTFLKNLREDPVVYDNLGSFIIPNMDKQEKWFKGLTNSSEYLIFEKIENDIWERVGIVRLTSIDNLNRSVCIGADIAKVFRGKGLSKVLYSLIFELCFNKMNMNRVWLLVMSTNEIAKNLYKKLGFVYEGAQRQAILRDQKYIDYEMYGLLKDEYNEI
jgi:RimJ/RimL family protein N-acetyltransferase